MTYLARCVDPELDELMRGLPAIALEGARGVGKTETASRRAGTVLRLDQPAVAELVDASPGRVMSSPPGTVLLDEWQRLPAVWDMVRRDVDAGAPPGRYLLTGSSAPADAPTHSGAGRIVRVRMRPLSLAERRPGHATVSTASLLSGRHPAIEGTTDVDLETYVREIVGSGLPAVRELPPRARRAQLAGYLDRVVERDFPEQGLAVRRPSTLLAWLRAYAAATSTTASYNVVLDAATAGESAKPAKTTTIAYRDVLTRLYLLEPVPGWTPGRNHLTSLTQAPKHHLADPALAVELLGLDEDALLSGTGPGSPSPRDGAFLGQLFESLVATSVQVYAQSAEATLHHLRTRGGLQEVDLLVQRRDGRVLALEVKLASSVRDADVRHLLWLKDRLGDDLLDAVVVTTGTDAYRRRDGVAVVPAALLGP